MAIPVIKNMIYNPVFHSCARMEYVILARKAIELGMSESRISKIPVDYYECIQKLLNLAKKMLNNASPNSLARLSNHGISVRIDADKTIKPFRELTVAVYNNWLQDRQDVINLHTEISTARDFLFADQGNIVKESRVRDDGKMFIRIDIRKIYPRCTFTQIVRELNQYIVNLNKCAELYDQLAERIEMEYEAARERERLKRERNQRIENACREIRNAVRDENKQLQSTIDVVVDRYRRSLGNSDATANHVTQLLLQHIINPEQREPQAETQDIPTSVITAGTPNFYNLGNHITPESTAHTSNESVDFNAAAQEILNQLIAQQARR